MPPQPPKLRTSAHPGPCRTGQPARHCLFAEERPGRGSRQRISAEPAQRPQSHFLCLSGKVSPNTATAAFVCAQGRRQRENAQPSSSKPGTCESARVLAATAAFEAAHQCAPADIAEGGEGRPEEKPVSPPKSRKKERFEQSTAEPAPHRGGSFGPGLQILSLPDGANPVRTIA